MGLSHQARFPSHFHPNRLQAPGNFLDMTLRSRLAASTRPAAALNGAVLALAVLAAAPAATQAANYPVTPGQRSTAREVASRGVPLSALAPNAPDTYTVKRGDTL